MKIQDCILSVGDSFTGMSWLRQINFRKKNKIDYNWTKKQMVGRKLAEYFLERNIILNHQ